MAPVALLLAVVFAAPRLVAAQHHGPGPTPPPYPGHPFNITVYHVNEGSYGAAPIDMNTADINGDMFFDLRSKPLIIECANYDPANPGKLGHTCGNQEVNPPADDPLVVTKLVLTIAAPYGPYGRCNVCVNGSDGHGDYNCTDNAYVCNCGGYGSTSSACPPNVGYENVSSHFGSRGCGKGEANFQCWSGNTAKKVCTPSAGLWYSTTAEGYGTTWKVAEVTKRVAKSCSDDAINQAVERAAFASGCFQKCGPHATGPTRNTSDVCWITCFEETVLGPDAGSPGGAVTGMDLEDLVAAWQAPFASTDPSRSGCPPLPTGPIPPLPAGSPLAHLPGAEPRE